MESVDEKSLSSTPNLDKSVFPEIYSLTHSSIPFVFSQNTRDFFVREIPLYPFSGNGEHLIVEVRKKSLSTQEMLHILSSHLGCSDFGYAGLKDKKAIAIQFISLHKKYQNDLLLASDRLQEKGIKILSTTYHNNKLKLGHLRANSFFIRLKKVTSSISYKIEHVLKNIHTNGIPNFFGYQRFGKFQDNHMVALEMLILNKKIRNKNIKNFLISSLQSYIFNLYLAKRISLGFILENFRNNELLDALKSQGFSFLCEKKDLISQLHQPMLLKILPGDVMGHYPTGKLFHAEDISECSNRFYTHMLTPQGPLFGRKCFEAKDIGQKIESQVIQDFLKNIIQNTKLNLTHDSLPSIKSLLFSSMMGGRRHAWVWPEDLKWRYIPQEGHFEIEFKLPKGSYATILIRELARRDIFLD